MNASDRLFALAQLARQMGDDTTAIDEAARVIVEAIKAGGTVYCCGNGGSMAQAQHFAAELTGRYRRERRPVAAVALGSNPAHVTCTANDYGYTHALARELNALLRSRDVTVMLSTSGRSPSILAVAEVAHGRGSTVAITGPGHALEHIDHHVVIPSTDPALIQEASLSAIHSIAEAIDEVIE